jgi:hypothetical protein
MENMYKSDRAIDDGGIKLVGNISLDVHIPQLYDPKIMI